MKDSASCRHSCPYCEDETPWSTPSKLNTLGSLMNWHELWLANGSRNATSKFHQNMRHKPLLQGDPDTLILDLFVPSELNLLLGITDKLITELRRNVFETNAGKVFMSAFYKKEKVVPIGV